MGIGINVRKFSIAAKSKGSGVLQRSGADWNPLRILYMTDKEVDEILALPDPPGCELADEIYLGEEPKWAGIKRLY